MGPALTWQPDGLHQNSDYIDGSLHMMVHSAIFRVFSFRARAVTAGIAVAALAVVFLMNAAATYALSAGEVSVTGITPFAALDSNSPCSAGPRAMFVQANVKNTSASTLAALSASFTGFTGAGFALAPGESPNRYIGTLAPGATASLFWYTDYTCTIGVATSYSLVVADGRSGTVTSGPLTVTTRSEISASAGGHVANVLLGQGAVVGQILPYTVSYTFGNPSSGADVMIQPAGNANFNSNCYRLIGDNIISSNFTAGLLAGANNQLYFSTVSGGSSNAASVVYRFEALCMNIPTTAAPFSDQKSGGPLKYTDNFSTSVTVITMPAATNAFVVGKTASPTQLPAGGAVTYTVTLTKISNFDAYADQFLDNLPVGVSFTGYAAGSQVTTANSSISPTVGATGSITWSGTPLSSYLVPANSSIQLMYTANVTATPGTYNNSASVIAGTVTTGPAAATVAVGSADMAIAIAAAPSPATNGSPLHFTLGITNAGPTGATGVVVTTTLPAGVTYGSATLSQGSCVLTGQVLVCSIGSMALNATLGIDILVTPTAIGVMTAVTQVTANQFDPNLSNNSAQATVTVNGVPSAVTLEQFGAVSGGLQWPEGAAILTTVLAVSVGLLLSARRR